jgi:hypothetical protein
VSSLSFRCAALAATFLYLVAAVIGPLTAGAADFVLHISVDGLRPDAITALGALEAPNFYRFRNEGAFTDNARTDFDYTITLPNHTSQLTGRPVLDAFGLNSGHHYTNNTDPGPATLASNAGYYIASALDVAHDNGLSTGLYATKSKFSLYEATYSANGAPDVTGVDNGADKIDVYVNSDLDSGSLMTTLLGNMGAPATRTNYTFVHFYDADSAGHGNSWDVTEPPDSPYLDAVRAVDGYLGQIFGLIASTPALDGHTAIILSADHGGIEDQFDHGDATSADDYTIPFYVWGAGVTVGDLYAMNAGTRLDPGTGRPLYSDPSQPIRNGEMANLALDLLGLGPVPGSGINFAQNLVVPEPSGIALLAAGFGALMAWRRLARLSAA